MTIGNVELNGFFKFTLANVLTIVGMIVLIFSGINDRDRNYAANSATTVAMLASHAERIKSLEDANRTFSTQLTEIQNKVNILVAIADEQRKAQHAK